MYKSNLCACAMLMYLFASTMFSAAQARPINSIRHNTDSQTGQHTQLSEGIDGGHGPSSENVSYRALHAGDALCAVRGSSYYNCLHGAPSNPYSRGCSAITSCRG